ncbi:uncharacterized protein Tco025E_00392 [Trypanosoma conorhini]|uniref:Uncharacterized protein n=1 Tax=Trypanosoma conorhini TaxID=83891 RepID=A0A422QBM1_9TRYP|nr:uncharacterized protein Tco025E_00392 [Trypanosoma conorhini]RNF27393.1 hypothetical protein Tco025E_00392 [Trypanosoma conorhini]
MAGAGESWFLGRPKLGIFKNAPIHTTKHVPFVRGNVQDFFKRTGDQRAHQVLFSKVKQCQRCRKSCAVTLSVCNRCSASLDDVQVTETPNLFSAFMLGIEDSGHFSLRISIRYETESYLVFDDPLALSPAHFCTIPTTDFIPDWRYLLRVPKEGLEIVQALVSASHKTFREQFLADPEWTSSILLDSDLVEAKHTLIGFNFPPSQNQLHLQYIAPPLIPHQYFMYSRGQHFTYNRFFPLSYVQKCLSALTKKPDPLGKHASLLDLPIDEMVDILDSECDISYKSEHAKFFLRVEEMQNRFANWTKDKFQGRYILPENDDAKKGSLLFKPFSGDSFYVDENVAFAEEKEKLQNYGRPYNEEGKPSGGFYAFPKSLEDIKVWS